MKQTINEILTLVQAKKSKKASLLMLISLGVTLMSAAHGKLVLATGMGVGGMILIYYGQGWIKSVNWIHFKQYFRGSQGKLVLAVTGGGIVAVATYVTAQVWTESENRWFVLATLVQSAATTATLGWALSKLSQEEHPKKEHHWQPLLNNLTSEDPLKRLIAVRGLIHLWQNSHLSEGEESQLLDYFALMLSTEPEIKVRQALLEALRHTKGDSILLQPLKSPQISKINLPETY